MSTNEGKHVYASGIARLAPKSEAELDLSALTRLRAAVGADLFDEVFEDAIFEVTERLARIEQTVLIGDLFSLGRLANDLAVLSGRIGMCGVADIASSLEGCCASEDHVAATAVSERLLRVGEESLVRAAEMSVEIGVPLEGA